MASFVLIGIIFGLHFLVFQCEGKVSLKSGEATRCAQVGDTVEIEWEFDASMSDLISRIWQFERKTIARIIDDENVTYFSHILPSFKVEKPAKLILNNVDSTYEGTYSFQASPEISQPNKIEVDFTIAVEPTVTVCNSSLTVKEGDNVTCLCKGEGGKPPANVTWFDKDGNQIGNAGVGKQTLNRIVSGNDGGNYKCKAESCNLVNEKSVQVNVTTAPTKPTFGNTPRSVAFGSKGFTITCEARAIPRPSFKIFHNNTVVANKRVYVIDVVKYEDAGPYKCVAINPLGNVSSDALNLTVTANVPTSTSTQTISPTSTMITMPSSTVSASGPSLGKRDDDDGPSVGRIVGIVIGALVLIIIIVVMVWWWCKSKENERENEGNGADANSSDRSVRSGDTAPASSDGDTILKPIFLQLMQNLRNLTQF